MSEGHEIDWRAHAERAEALAAEERERGHEALRKGMAAAQKAHDEMRAAQARAASADWRQSMVVREVAAEMRVHDEELDAAIARAERAEAQLAALREAAKAVVHVAVVPYSDNGDALLQAFDAALADTAAAAEEYTRRVRAEGARDALSNAAGGLEMSAHSIGEHAKADDGERRTFTARDVRKARQGAYEECADTLRAGARAADEIEGGR